MKSDYLTGLAERYLRLAQAPGMGDQLRVLAKGFWRRSFAS